jgi:hypothetical protein
MPAPLEIVCIESSDCPIEAVQIFAPLIVPASLLPVALDVFGFLVINVRESVARVALRMQKFVELCLYSLGFAMFCALNESHEHRRHCVPVEVSRSNAAHRPP